jgi:glycine C-acetyltransferase
MGMYDRLESELASIRDAGLTKVERILTSPQGPTVTVDGRHGSLINLCANNYLGLAADPRIVRASCEAAERWGAGLASVRFICGTQQIHKELEASIAHYLGFEDAILFAAAFDANGGLFEPLLDGEDVLISDALNHASIIDGARLSKAKRLRFATGDMDELESALRQARSDGARNILIATDGVFSMDGVIAKLDAIADLADRFDAQIVVDDCHATGLIGPEGRGTPALCGVADRIDIVTGTFGKALGGAMGGFVAARRPVVEMLRQRARPYLFSNALAPSICGASLAAIEIARSGEGEARRARLAANAARFRTGLTAAGFDLPAGMHPIIPVMINDAHKTQAMAGRLLDLGVCVTGFSFPVVPRSAARIRTQMCASHSPEQIDHAAAAFVTAGREMAIIQ